ncbi:hypothetical protein [Pseudodesulfovibrio karagichevae]|uniref:Uncharacterized protein n=1 Tax=Pseudodesulfovibrio karagichevae TaxID=3239305 RepID=A0ABV4JXF9_9BACT
MTIRVSTILRNALGDAITTLADAGTAAAHLKIYSGTKPATKGTAPSGDVLADFIMADPIAGSSASGIWTASAVSSVTAGNAGVPTFAVLEDSDGTYIADLDARLSTATDNGEEVVVTISGGGTSIAAGATVSLSSATLTMPNA